MAANPGTKRRFRNRRMSTGARDLQSELLASAKLGNLKAVKQLVEIGANINATDAMGQTALHIAAYNEQEELCEYLVLNGVNTDLEANDGMTAYQLAMAEELEDVARIIRERTRDVNALKTKGLPAAALKAELRLLWEKALRKRGMADEKADAAAAVRAVDSASTAAKVSGTDIKGNVEVTLAASAGGKPKPRDVGLISPKGSPKPTQEATRTVEVEVEESSEGGVHLPAVAGAAAGAAGADSPSRKVPPPPKRPSVPQGLRASPYVQAVMAKAAHEAAPGSATTASPLSKRLAPAAAPVSDDPMATGLTAEETRKLVAGASEEALAAHRAMTVEEYRLRAFDAQNPGYLATLVAAKSEANAGRSNSSFGSEVVRLWLGALALEQYTEQLVGAGYDSLARLCLMEEEDLKEFTDPKVLPGHRRHLIRAVATLKKEIAAAST